MICDLMKRLFPPPLTGVAFVEGMEKIRKDPEFAEQHLRECAECRDYAERAGHLGDEPRLQLIVVVEDWWKQVLKKDGNEPQLPVM
jgi:predicted anti-sigma-YlaC factor YlaD